MDCTRHYHVTLAQLIWRWYFALASTMPPFAVAKLELELGKGGSPAYVSIGAITHSLMGTSGAFVFAFDHEAGWQ